MKWEMAKHPVKKARMSRMETTKIAVTEDRVTIRKCKHLSSHGLRGQADDSDAEDEETMVSRTEENKTEMIVKDDANKP